MLKMFVLNAELIVTGCDVTYLLTRSIWLSLWPASKHNHSCCCWFSREEDNACCNNLIWPAVPHTHTHSFKCHMSMFCKAKPHYYFVVLTCRSTRKVNTIVSFIKVTGEKKNSGSYGCLPLVLYIICSTAKFLLWMHEQYNYGLCAFTVYLGLLPFS